MCLVGHAGSLVVVRVLVQPPIPLLQALQRQLGEGKPRHGHVGRTSNVEGDAAKLEQIRGGREAEIHIDAAAHRRLLGPIEVPAPTWRGEDGDVDTLRAAPSTHARAS